MTEQKKPQTVRELGTNGQMIEREVAQVPYYLDAEGVLTCPRCGCQDFSVYRTYDWQDGKKLRKRECNNCHSMLQTIEIVAENR